MEPGTNLSVSSFLLTTPLNGNPFARPYGQLVSHDKTQNSENVLYLGYCHNIGSDTTVFNVEVLSSPTEPALYFIHDQENVIFVANVAQAL
jgi:hypothetical protein